MKVIWNTCRRELGGMKSVNAMKANTKSSFENFQRELSFKEIYAAKVFRKTVYRSELCYISFFSFNLLWNQKLVINIRFICNYMINQ